MTVQMPNVARRWKELESLFDQALSLPMADRERFVQSEACPVELREELRGLLDADHTECGSSLVGMETLVSRQTESFLKAGDATGMRLGPYRLVEKIAEGGMGSVYLGKREDRDFQQTVAVKLMRQVLPSESAVERFRQERRLLARLNHPNIARLIDGGMTESGLPYLVMEYVTGEAIHSYCEKNQLLLRERLALFAKVCGAVAVAHRNLIVHRDLKASNILVTAEREPKLLDFGIAKVLDADAFDQALQTREMSRMMTPEFASPEQIRGEAVTTATDVYALGTLLYQLLTNKYPYASWRSDPLQLQNAVCNEEPPLPSRVTSAAEPSRSRELKGDLDAIVAKAMRKEARLRYRGAQEVGEDIQRYLTHQPVSARAGTTRYRMQKFLRRHIGALSVSVAVVVTFIGLIGNYTARLADKRDLANGQRLAAESAQSVAVNVADFLVGMFAYANPERENPDTTAEGILDAAMVKLGGDAQNVAGGALAAGRLFRIIGESYHALGKWKKAIDAWSFSIHAWQGAGEEYTEEQVRVLLQKGELQGQLEHWQGSRDSLIQALSMVKSGTNLEVDVLAALMRVEINRGEYNETTRQNLLKAYQATQSLEANQSFRSQFLALQLATWHRLNFRFSDAAQWLHRAEEGMQQQSPREQARLLQSRGLLKLAQGQYAAAKVDFDAIVEKRASAVEVGHFEWADPYYFRAVCLAKMGRFGEAQVDYARAVALEEQGAERGKGRYLSRALLGWADLLLDMGRADLAKTQYQRALNIPLELGGALPVPEQSALFTIKARLLESDQQRAQANVVWEELVQLLMQQPMQNLYALGIAQLARARNLRLMQAFEPAERALVRAQKYLRELVGPLHPDFALVQAEQLQLESKDNTLLAINSLEDVESMLRESGMGNDSYAEFLEFYAGQQELRKAVKQARQLREQAVKIRHAQQSAARQTRDLGYVLMHESGTPREAVKAIHHITPSECQDHCSTEMDFDCRASSFYEQMQICVLYDAVVDDISELTAGNENVYSDYFIRVDANGYPAHLVGWVGP